jgi:hypothetical protein
LSGRNKKDGELRNPSIRYIFLVKKEDLMPSYGNRCDAPFVCALFIALCLLISPVVGLTASGETSTDTPANRKASPGWAREIVRRGDKVILSRAFVDEVKKNNDIVLSKVAIKARLDKDGQILGYQLFQIDRGSAVERMGFKPKDILTSVNSIPARDFEAQRRSLEIADGFDVTILRNGVTKKVRVEIE